MTVRILIAGTTTSDQSGGPSKKTISGSSFDFSYGRGREVRRWVGRYGGREGKGEVVVMVDR